MEWLVGLGYGLGTFFLVVGVVILVLGKFASNSLTSIGGSVSGEHAAINNSGYTITATSVHGFSNPALTAAYNSSVPIALANFSMSASGVVKNITSQAWNNATISYTYNYYDPAGANASEAATYGVTQLGSAGLLGWAPAIIAIVIGVFFLSYFMGKGEGRRYR